MPLIDISLAAGRDAQQVRALISEVHRAVRDSLGVPDERIRVLVREVPPTHWAAGDVTLQERTEQSA
ncbi:4-oxalocrotonate tautomerase family protein [Streptomyces sp. NPDC038707]|uniref:tautomerase family protein n=1 Tax=unclassified Streptomyces TaxID=2593676 RepID=UPI0034071FF1